LRQGQRGLGRSDAGGKVGQPVLKAPHFDQQITTQKRMARPGAATGFAGQLKTFGTGADRAGDAVKTGEAAQSTF